jgi:hypothetical protein
MVMKRALAALHAALLGGAAGAARCELADELRAEIVAMGERHLDAVSRILRAGEEIEQVAATPTRRAVMPAAPPRRGRRSRYPARARLVVQR